MPKNGSSSSRPPRQAAEQPGDLGVANVGAEVVLDRDVRGGLAAVLPVEAAGDHLGADAPELRGGVRRQGHRWSPEAETGTIFRLAASLCQHAEHNRRPQREKT